MDTALGIDAIQIRLGNVHQFGCHGGQRAGQAQRLTNDDLAVGHTRPRMQRTPGRQQCQ